MDGAIPKFSQWVADSPGFAQVKYVAGEIASNKTNMVFFVLFLVVLAVQFRGFMEPPKRLKKGATLQATGFPSVEPLMTFDWKKTEPLKFRPFKPKYHLTMSLENLDPSELIPMDNTYRERIELRRELLKSQNRNSVLGVNNEKDPRVRAAVSELYTFILGTYLPGRYPRMFKLHTAKYESGTSSVLENTVTGEILPTAVSPNKSTSAALETLGRTIDEDLLVLLPEEGQGSKDTNSTDSDATTIKYILEAFVACFPSGFDPAEKLGKRLNRIHDPVPNYPDKLEKSMDRFFSKLEVGKFVKRLNWSITTNGGELFAAFGTLHGRGGDDLKPMKVEELDVEKTHLRCERQTLYRLPTSKALVFGIHTYTYPIQEVKDEGCGEELAQAIDGLKEGSVPAIHFYKRGPVWGEALKAFLKE